MSSYVEYTQHELEWKEEQRAYVNGLMPRSKMLCLAYTGFFLALFFLEMPTLLKGLLSIDPPYNGILANTILAIAALSAAVTIVGAYNLYSRRNELDDDIQECKFEKELAGYHIEEREIRAERLFRRNEYELLKYYNLARKQNRWILYIGIGAIAASLVIVFVTLALVFGIGPLAKMTAPPPAGKEALEVWYKGIAGVVGAVGAIMINVVAAIYLQIHAKASEALIEFHKRLVGTHQLFLSNTLASRIEEKQPREALLADLAKTIAGGAVSL